MPACGVVCCVPRAYLLRLPKDRDVRAAQRAYERDPNVHYAEPNYIDEPARDAERPALPAVQTGGCTTPARTWTGTGPAPADATSTRPRRGT